mmetsp:Transcript_20584/g.42418  ORF Transcript_20584/g.42418 Transcript_20584/m.42418 type:complete len:269 (-) Transcript_20584:1257-2063(-)
MLSLRHSILPIIQSLRLPVPLVFLPMTLPMLLPMTLPTHRPTRRLTHLPPTPPDHLQSTHPNAPRRHPPAAATTNGASPSTPVTLKHAPTTKTTRLPGMRHPLKLKPACFSIAPSFVARRCLAMSMVVILSKSATKKKKKTPSCHLARATNGTNPIKPDRHRPTPAPTTTNTPRRGIPIPHRCKSTSSRTVRRSVARSLSESRWRVGGASSWRFAILLPLLLVLPPPPPPLLVPLRQLRLRPLPRMTTPPPAPPPPTPPNGTYPPNRE